MAIKNNRPASKTPSGKAPSGINGFDEITGGGLPANRPTIICGNTGCGKTIMSMEFLVNGAKKYNERGVFMSFEETTDELKRNMDTLPYDLDHLIRSKNIYIEYLDIDKVQMIEAGNYDLEGLFLRIHNAIKSIGAKRLVIDSLHALFFGLDADTLKLEIKRLFKWLKQIKVTAIVTSNAYRMLVLNEGLEQYVADSVIELSNEIINQTAIRRIRVKKMRGSLHGNNEYPFVIGKTGVSVLPLISSVKYLLLSEQSTSSGIADLDGMLNGKGYYVGSSILVSGSAGTGKTSLAVSLVNATSKSKRRSLYCAFEESASQINRNMRSIGHELEPYIKSGLLRFYCSRPTLQNLELHLIAIKNIIDEFKPEVIVLDPITNLFSEGINSDIRQLLAHFVDYLKEKNITSLFTAAITFESIKSNPSDEGISAMMDTWILVRDIEKNSERNRGIYVLKSRGMNHSTQVREFAITKAGIAILPIYIGATGILTGTEKLEHTLQEQQMRSLNENKAKNELAEIEIRRRIMEEKIAMIKNLFEIEVDTLKFNKSKTDIKEDTKKQGKKAITDLRTQVNSSIESPKSRNK